MSVVTSMITIIILAFVFIRTMSFIAWNWKNDNKFGSIMVLFVCVASVALPLYMAFFRT
ncbi:MAG: hypothetical protein ABFD25_02045 [Clostridiaceae bacterium]